MIDPHLSHRMRRACATLALAMLVQTDPADTITAPASAQDLASSPPSAQSTPRRKKRSEVRAEKKRPDDVRAAASGLGVRPADSGQAAGGSRSIEKLTGVWIEGPGYDVTYGAAYETCGARCLADAKCVMIEYYRPERKCNHYSAVRPRKTGGSSVVGIKN